MQAALRRFSLPITVPILLFATALIVTQMWRSGWCVDESAHLPSGWYHLSTGRMEAYRVNPPLPRMIAALPLWLSESEMAWYEVALPVIRLEFLLAVDFIENFVGQEIQQKLFLCRLTYLLFFAVGGLSVYLWAL